MDAIDPGARAAAVAGAAGLALVALAGVAFLLPPRVPSPAGESRPLSVAVLGLLAQGAWTAAVLAGAGPAPAAMAAAVATVLAGVIVARGTTGEPRPGGATGPGSLPVALAVVASLLLVLVASAADGFLRRGGSVPEAWFGAVVDVRSGTAPARGWAGLLLLGAACAVLASALHRRSGTGPGAVLLAATAWALLLAPSSPLTGLALGWTTVRFRAAGAAWSGAAATALLLVAVSVAAIL